MSQSISDKPVVKHIIEHCYAHGVRYVVISPGSRNAPLIISFPKSKKFTCLTIVDERSAAYFALGLARKERRPVALVCTSGTAVLNYAPAISEAYYQQIPLIAITADRPPEYIDQADGQTIRQKGIFSNFTRYECHLPAGDLSEGDRCLVDRSLNEAFRNALGVIKGPVHINVPFREPLYETVDTKQLPQPVIVSVPKENYVNEPVVDELFGEISLYQKILLIVGAVLPCSELTRLVADFAAKGIVVVTENLSNLPVPDAFGNTDRIIEGFDNENDLRPDLLITLDFPVLSKKLKQRIRRNRPGAHWHFSSQNVLVDTYQCLTRQIAGDAVGTLLQLNDRITPIGSGYIEAWQKADFKTRIKHNDYLDGLTWCDLKVFEQISQKIPGGQEVHLANSTPVRYAQLFQWDRSLTFFANRGTSGIDGCVSTAAGSAISGDRPVTLISGDLAFFYDSNGLWHRYLQDAFRVIVINNGGGGIFRFIPGSSETEELESFFEARNNDYQCCSIAETFGLLYFSAHNNQELKQVLDHFWEDKGKPALLEIFTSERENGEILRDYFRQLKTLEF
jgi:2-succinyl-5-enolpyruvyl-6-hydroxy-3-cyclohexene-1-carboxylate synthase